MVWMRAERWVKYLVVHLDLMTVGRMVHKMAAWMERNLAALKVVCLVDLMVVPMAHKKAVCLVG